MEFFFANIISTSIAEIATLPICTTKTNMQVNNTKFLDTIKKINREKGLMGFYSASIPSVMSQCISSSTKYSFYKFLNNFRKTEKNDYLNQSINGVIGGIGGSLFSHPFDVWKNYKQRNENIINRIRNNGVKIIYSGFTQSIAKNISLYSVLYPVYDFYQNKFNNPLISSPLTTFTISIFVQPTDYLKTRFMANNYKIILKDLYNGYFLMNLRNIPHFMITMYFTEKIIKYL